MDNIGKNIAEFRKSKGITQETLAEAAGVTVQAVSKWENGGMPDTALLPAIADFFEVPIDALFGRDANKHIDIQPTVRKHLLSSVGWDKDIDWGNGDAYRKMMKEFFEICWAVHRLYISPDLNDASYAKTLDESIKNVREHLEKEGKDIDKMSQIVSRNIVNGGTTFTNIKGLPYFMLMLEPENGWKSELFSIEEYCGLFQLLGNTDTLKTIFWLCERPLLEESGFKPFTKKGFKDTLGFTDEQAEKQIDILINLKFITQHELELDDITTKIYKPTIAQSPMLPLLTIAKELINPLFNLRESGHWGHRWNNNRASLI